MKFSGHPFSKTKISRRRRRNGERDYPHFMKNRTAHLISIWGLKFKFHKKVLKCAYRTELSENGDLRISMLLLQKIR